MLLMHFLHIFEEVDQSLKATRALYNKRHKQEELLGKIFNDCYGSDREWKLEMDLDLTAEHRERIKTADYKWKNAQTFLNTARDQVSWAARRWAQIATINSANTMVRTFDDLPKRMNMLRAPGTHSKVHLSGFWIPKGLFSKFLIHRPGIWNPQANIFCF